MIDKTKNYFVAGTPGPIYYCCCLIVCFFAPERTKKIICYHDLAKSVFFILFYFLKKKLNYHLILKVSASIESIHNQINIFIQVLQGPEGMIIHLCITKIKVMTPSLNEGQHHK